MKETLNNTPELKNTSEKEKEKTSLGKEIFSWVKTLAIALLLALFINNFILANAQVLSGSMENSMKKGDRLICTRYTYWFNDPERGDIVLFTYPVDEAKGIKRNFVKRVIGLPGEEVKIQDAKIYINGEVIDEPYLKEEWYRENTGMVFQVPEDCYFVLGDNRNNSKDSRYWAKEALSTGVAKTEEEAMQFTFVKRDKIFGKGRLRYWPLSEITVYHDPEY